MGNRNGRAGPDTYQPTRKQKKILPYINDTPYMPRGDRSVATRRRKSNPPRDKNGRQHWHASTPDLHNPDYRWFWLFFKLAILTGLILGIMVALGG